MTNTILPNKHYRLKFGNLADWEIRKVICRHNLENWYKYLADEKNSNLFCQIVVFAAKIACHFVILTLYYSVVDKDKQSLKISYENLN